MVDLLHHVSFELGQLANMLFEHNSHREAMSVKDAPTSCLSRNGTRHDSRIAATAAPSGSAPSAALDGPGASLRVQHPNHFITLRPNGMSIPAMLVRMFWCLWGQLPLPQLNGPAQRCPKIMNTSVLGRPNGMLFFNLPC